MLKCVIWDLDQTLWEGILAEGDVVRARPEALELVNRLEASGIVQSIASKNDHDLAMKALGKTGVAEIFVCPQISWSAKSAGVAQILERLNINPDSVLFLDDSEFERAEVGARFEHIRCVSLPEFLADPERQGIPRHVTEEGARRPETYRREVSRQAAQSEFQGTPSEFLASLGMVLTLRPASRADLERAEELTERTHQLNTTGTTFSAEELAERIAEADSDVIMAELTDRFGDHGRIGLALLRQRGNHLTIELLLLSCRVMGRSMGTALIAFIGHLADTRGLALRALYRANARNRQMKITYALLGFARVDEAGDLAIYEHPAPASIRYPPYIRVVSTDSSQARPR